MSRLFLSLIAPPVAVCKYGCGDCYAAPVGVFWLAGLCAVGYGLLGGPVSAPHVSLSSILLGLALWGVAVLAATIATRGAGSNLCEPPRSDNLVRSPHNARPKQPTQ
ncbi:MAG: hypothetical protein ACWGNB_01780 [Thiogranum sp.]